MSKSVIWDREIEQYKLVVECEDGWVVRSVDGACTKRESKHDGLPGWYWWCVYKRAGSGWWPEDSGRATSLRHAQLLAVECVTGLLQKASAERTAAIDELLAIVADGGHETAVSGA